MPANALSFSWTTQPLTLTTGQLTAKLNDSLRALVHDLSTGAGGTDRHGSLRLNKITAPAPIPGLAQVFIDVSDGGLKVLFGDGVLKILATDP